MSAVTEHRRLAAIMFTDMVGYSALCQKDERLANQLLEDHRRMVRAALATLGGREVDTTGDGFLLEFQSAVQAVHCAILIQQRQAERNAAIVEARRFQFRVGIHLGEIESDERNIVGDGVNIAARLEPLSPHGGLAISGAVHTLVRNHLSADFRSVGTPPLKNISEAVEVFLLDPAAVRAVQLPKPEARKAQAKPRRRSWKLIALVAFAILLWFRQCGDEPKGTAVREDAEKSIAVLPFSNFSSDKENEYFASGIHDSLLTHLARVKDLKVISRTSVMQYKDGARNLREIGEELGVAHIVEGSVQRTGNRVRVQAQLIEAASDRHLWAESYDRDMADVFAIQTEIAEQIVAAVRGALTPQEKSSIERRPTGNAEAYDLYLRAAELYRQPNFNNREASFSIQTLLEQAVALDPDFALAYAAQSRLHSEAYWWGLDTTARRRDQAKAAVETALRLQPDLPEAHLAMGMYFYHCYRDYEHALEEFEEALRGTPGSADTRAAIGYVQRRRGQWDQSVETLKRAAELDPGNASAQLDIADTYVGMRRYGEAAAAFEKARALAPEDVGVRLAALSVVLLRTGETGPMRKVLESLPAGVDPGEAVSIARILLARFEGRYADAVALLTALPRDGFPLGSSNFVVPKDFIIGQSYRAMGDMQRARTHFARAREQVQAYIEQEPDSVNLAEAHAWLGLTQANLGDRDAALRNAGRAVELLPASRDAYDGPEIAMLAAATRMRLGDHDRALAELAPLLSVPGGLHAHLLKRDPEWQPLWNDARFQKLIAEHLPKDR